MRAHAVALLLALLAAPGAARAEVKVGLPAPRLRVPAPAGKLGAEVRARARGGEALWVDGRLLWPEAEAGGEPRVASDLVWSRKADGVAFLSVERGGQTRLVVVLVAGEGTPAALSWDVPRSALPVHKVMWLGEARVGAGPAELEPHLVASWKTAR